MDDNKYKRLILFRYHKKFSVCRLNVQLIRKLNPGCKIIGLYGGSMNKPIPESLLDEFDGNYILPFRFQRFKWQNGDLCIRQWFIDEGYKYDFEALNLIEWDLVLLKPLDEMYKITSNSFGVAKRETYKHMLKDWFWFVDGIWKLKWEKQVEEAKNLLGKDFDLSKFFFSIFGGIQIPREFLEKYAPVNPSAYTNDEARICLYAQAMGFSVKDTALASKKNVFMADSYRSLNNEMFIEKIKNGATALHPVRTVGLFKKILRSKKTPETVLLVKGV